MKKILFFAICTLFAFTSCKIDNFPGPDAQIHGSIVDEKTGELVGTDIQNGSSIKVIEDGYTSTQTWNIKNTGEYRNNLVFSAKYEVIFENGNFYPFNQNIDVKPGDNKIDFKVTPYLRVKNPSITKNGDVITATFSLEAGKDEVKVKEVQLFAFSDMWVGNSVRYTLKGGTDKQSLGSVAVDPSQTYTLTINVKDNDAVFKYKRNYYFRIGALADVAGVGTVRHNYAPLVVIAL